MTTAATLRHDTPAGPLTTIVDDGVVIAAGFTDDADALAARLAMPAAPPRHRVPAAAVDAAVNAYLDGDTAALDQLAVRQPGTAFQQRVWQQLRAIPPGTTATYTDLAVAVGRPRASRAVGSACGRNLLAPFVPCHRAVRADGSLGGYFYGLSVKAWLLQHEAGHSG